MPRTSCLLDASILSVALQVVIEVIIRLVQKQEADVGLRERDDGAENSPDRVLVVVVRQIDTGSSRARHVDVLDGRVQHPGGPDAIVAQREIANVERVEVGRRR